MMIKLKNVSTCAYVIGIDFVLFSRKRQQQKTKRAVE